MPQQTDDADHLSNPHPASDTPTDAINRSLALHGEALPEDETVHNAIQYDSRLIEQSTG